MTGDRSVAIVITYTSVIPERNPHRVVFEPRSNGDWTRYTEVKTEDGWRETGSGIVASVSVETPD